MQDFWTWFLSWWPTIVGSVTAVVTAGCSYAVYRFKMRSQKAKTVALMRELDNAKLRLTYHVCPYCGHQVRLDECRWKLPGDLADENLNGVPDNQED